jgi:hypothetical protein
MRFHAQGKEFFMCAKNFETLRRGPENALNFAQENY